MTETFADRQTRILHDEDGVIARHVERMEAERIAKLERWIKTENERNAA